MALLEDTFDGLTTLVTAPLVKDVLDAFIAAVKIPILAAGVSIGKSITNIGTVFDAGITSMGSSVGNLFTLGYDTLAGAAPSVTTWLGSDGLLLAIIAILGLLLLVGGGLGTGLVTTIKAVI